MTTAMWVTVLIVVGIAPVSWYFAFQRKLKRDGTRGIDHDKGGS